ncbi:MAG: hypothetical protein ABL888_07645 [Pirellulaceae bacterium]
MQASNFIPALQAAATTHLHKVTIGPKTELPTNIKLHKCGETIEAIEIRCACGEIIIIQCEYGSSAQ